MANTRLDLRNYIRRELQDTGGSPFWSDLALNDDIAAAFAAYSEYFPNPSTVSLTSTAGQTTVALGAGVVAVYACVVDGLALPQVPDAEALYEPAFRNQISQTVVQPVTPFGAAATHGQAWALLAGQTLTFRYALAVGRAVSIYAGLFHVLPSDDVTAVTVPDNDVELITLYACDRLVQSAATDAVKRGTPGAWVEGHGGITRYAERFETALRRRRQFVRSSTVTVLQ